MSLAEIRVRLEAVSSPEERERMAAILRLDPRSGARSMGEAVDRGERARRTERERLVRFFARREQLLQSGVNFVAGVDEVGVGPLAGPLVAAAVIFPREVELDALSGLDDSKRVARKVREALDREIRRQAAAVFVAEVSSSDVDRLNPHGASLAAMKRAVSGLQLQPGHVLVDARTIPDLAIPQTALIHGDALDASIAAASSGVGYSPSQGWSTTRMRGKAERSWRASSGAVSRRRLNASETECPTRTGTRTAVACTRSPGAWSIFRISASIFSSSVEMSLPSRNPSHCGNTLKAGTFGNC
ncbi:MAG: ribonuclease HII [Myxococcales bacterium]|nr:ribonuclease HII [Myxococcales bacterium]